MPFRMSGKRTDIENLENSNSLQHLYIKKIFTLCGKTNKDKMLLMLLVIDVILMDKVVWLRFLRNLLET